MAGRPIKVSGTSASGAPSALLKNSRGGIPIVPIQDTLHEQYIAYAGSTGEELVVRIVPRSELSAPAKTFLSRLPLEAQDMYDTESDVTRCVC